MLPWTPAPLGRACPWPGQFGRLPRLATCSGPLAIPLKHPECFSNSGPLHPLSPRTWDALALSLPILQASALKPAEPLLQQAALMHVLKETLLSLPSHLPASHPHSTCCFLTLLFGSFMELSSAYISSGRSGRRTHRWSFNARSPGKGSSQAPTGSHQAPGPPHPRSRNSRSGNHLSS